MAESFYLLLTHADLLMLQQFRSPEDVAVYYAAVKTLALVAFIYFSIAATTAHRVAAYHAAGDREGLANFMRKAIALTFWPSLVATVVLLAFGKPILSLFGPQFTDGYHLMFILAVGLLARAAIGPMERFLNVIGKQRVSALIYGGAFAVNIVLCIVLIPPLGAAGAAIAISTALIVETVALVVTAETADGLEHLRLGPAQLAFGDSRARHDRIRFQGGDQTPRRACGVRRRPARPHRPGARAQRVLRARRSWRRRRRCSAATCWPAWCGAARMPRAADRLLPGRDRAPPLRLENAGAGGLDPSLRTARHAADRPRRAARPRSRPGSITSPPIPRCRSSC